MKTFLNYLIKCKKVFKSLQPNSKIHIVLGNEACDMDSTISSLLLAYLINSQKSLLNLGEQTLVLPIVNVASKYFELRTELNFCLSNAGITKDQLIFRDELNWQDLIDEHRVTTSLVDHHILGQNDRTLHDTVVQIFDHRPIDPFNIWNRKKTVIQIEQVGSCCTLIAQEIFRVDDSILNNTLALLLYQTIIYDTIALVPEHGKAKELDVNIATILETKFNLKQDRQKLFDQLWEAHNDITHLTPLQLLYKDLKVVQGIPIPGLPMLAEDYLKYEGIHEIITDFAGEFNSSLVLLIGLNASGGVKRDFAIFWTNEGLQMKDNLIYGLKRSEKTMGYDFCLAQIETKFSDIECYRQDNIKLSRKQIIPVVQDCLAQ